MLAIDTSTEMAGLALFDGVRVSELVWCTGRNQSSVLLGQIEYLLNLNRSSMSSVHAIAVAIGPGTFNGLRVGLSTAKGLAYGRSIPVLGVDTLEIAAFPHLDSHDPIRAFVPAGRGRIVFGDFQNRNGQWVRVGELQNRPFGELTHGLSDVTLVTGEAPSGLDVDGFEESRARFARASIRTRRPGHLAEIAWKRWKAGEADDIGALEPLYVHGARPGS
jgi:tRNA threonylcarbamoyladenosine biosynthesis protein TsaB